MPPTTSEEFRKREPHRFWQARIRGAARRLDRSRKESQWARWAKLAAMERTDKLHFAEAARRDIRLDVVGEVPIVSVKTYRHSESYLEEPMTKLAAVELDMEYNWDAVVRAADDASIAGIGWIRCEWVRPADQPEEPDLTPDQEGMQIEKAHVALQQALMGQVPQVAEDDAHYIHIQVLAEAMGSMGLNLAQRTALQQAVKQHQQAIPPLPAQGFRLMRIHPGDMLYDPTAAEWSKVEWIAERSVQRLEDVQANKEFKNTSNLKGKVEVRQPGYRRGRRNNMGTRYARDGANPSVDAMVPEDLYEVLWYIHDLRDNTLTVIAEDNPDDAPLIDKQPYPYPDAVYYPLVFDVEPDGIEGISDFRKIEFSSDKREEIQLRWIEHLALHSRGKILHTDDFVDEKGMSQMTDPNRVLVNVRSLAGYVQLNQPDINPDAYRVDGVMQENINRMLGSTDMSQGVGKGSNSATEASLLDTARGRVVRERRKRVSRMICWAIRTMLKFYREFADERIFVEKGASPEMDILINPEDITDDVWITADTDSLSPANVELEKQQTRQAIEVISASEWIMQGLGTKGRIEVLDKFLRTQRLVRDPREILNAAVAEMMAQPPVMAENARLTAGGGVPEAGAGQASGNLQSQVQTLAPGQASPAGPAGGAAVPAAAGPAMSA